jgi:hypothetical protein
MFFIIHVLFTLYVLVYTQLLAPEPLMICLIPHETM